MTEAEWLEGNRPWKMLDFLLDFSEVKPSDRKLRLFTCAICRRLWRLLTDERSRHAVKIADRFADGNATKEELAAAHEAAYAAAFDAGANEGEAGYHAAEAVQYLTSEAGGGCGPDAGACWILDAAAHDGTQKDQAVILHDIFGNPFRPSPPLVPAILAWNDGTVRCISEGIYAERAFDRLPILADALEDAGCANEELIRHCRSAGPHVRGCWAVDLVLGKG